jgi:cytochrome c biogenesis protein CcmG/thiol:disulfide interchange protein DsbE
MWRYLLPVLVFAGLLAVFAVGLQRDPSYVPSPLVGKPAPDFSLAALEDPSRTVTRADLLGKVSLVNVWGTWCTGCRQEHDVLMEIARESGIPIYGLNWKDDPALARRWLLELGNPYVAVAMDLDGRAAIDWGVYGAPETFLLDADGTVLYKHIAPLTMEIWRREFVPRIRDAQAGRT